MITTIERCFSGLSAVAALNLTDKTDVCENPQSLCIVIADDDKRMADLLSKNCQNLGHRVAAIGRNGKDAVELAHKFQPDLVILDLNMPGLDGIEVAIEIRNKQKVPIILSTGRVDEPTLRRVQYVGIEGYLVKPFSPAQLKVAIHMALHSAP